MKQKRTRTLLLMLFTAALIGIAAHSTARAQATGSAATSPTTAVADIDTCSRRLDKALDAYEKAIAVIKSKDDELAAKDALIALHKEYEAVKDQYIADVLADNKFLRGKIDGPKSKTRKMLEKIEKILIFGVGVYLGGR